VTSAVRTNQFLGVPRSSSEFLGDAPAPPRNPEELRGTEELRTHPRTANAAAGSSEVTLVSG
jgi:hypothetical protein